MLKEPGQAEPWQGEQLPSLVRVEHIDQVNREVALQPQNVAVAAMEDLEG